jgi:hypothetical protein
MTVMTGDEKHAPSATSTLDVLWVLYDQVLGVSPDTIDDPGRDRFLLSKGHGPAAYYAVLAAKGFIPESWLAGFGSAGSPLGYHPDRNFKTICRDWALSSGDDTFGEAPGEVGAGVVADPPRRSQVQVDVAVFALGEPGTPRRVLSLGEAKWDKVMNPGHLERLRRARDLLAVKGYDTSATRLACYSGARFDPELIDIARADPRVQLVGLDRLYG